MSELDPIKEAMKKLSGNNVHVKQFMRWIKFRTEKKWPYTTEEIDKVVTAIKHSEPIF